MSRRVAPAPPDHARPYAGPPPPGPRDWDRLSPEEACRFILDLWRCGRAHLIVREGRDAAEFGGEGGEG